jgi:[ribosomal protein S5]-alanine N-acetyltransferase
MLTTARLTLRRPASVDALAISVLGGAWEVASMTGRLPYPYTLAVAKTWIEDVQATDPLHQAFAIDRGGRLIGICGFTAEDASEAGIGYWIGKPYWGQGLATEAAGALVRFCFGAGGFQTLTAAHFSENAASGRVLTKLGFTLSGPGSGWCEATQSDRNTLTYRLINPFDRKAVVS